MMLSIRMIRLYFGKIKKETKQKRKEKRVSENIKNLISGS
jgi:hypothetical protein